MTALMPGLVLLSDLLCLGVGAWLVRRVSRAEAEGRRQGAELSRHRQEMAIAQRIQTALLPADPQVPGFEAVAAMVPATEVGGDLVDVLVAPTGEAWLAIGDVTGHGLTPGLIMMMAQSLFTGLVLADPGAAPATILALAA